MARTGIVDIISQKLILPINILSEDLLLGNKITENEISSDSNISDHISKKSDIINLECIISNSKFDHSNFLQSNLEGFLSSQAHKIIGIGGSLGVKVAGTFINEKSDILEDSFKILTEFRDKEVPFHFVGAFQIYENVAIENLKLNRKFENINSLSFRLSLKKIRIAYAKFENVAHNKVKNKIGKQNKGEPDIKNITSEKAKKNEYSSALYKIKELINGAK